MVNVDVSNSSEAVYVRTFRWEYNGYHFKCRGITEQLRDKLSEIFEKWNIGFDCDKVDCKPGTMNVNVSRRQFQRVQFKLDPSKITFVNGATHENL